MKVPGSRGRVVSLETLLACLGPEREQGRRVVFTNGCFDLLHAGHAADNHLHVHDSVPYFLGRLVKNNRLLDNHAGPLYFSLAFFSRSARHTLSREKGWLGNLIPTAL